MNISAYGLELFAAGSLLALWLVVLCRERDWFGGVRAAWKNMGWGTGTVMAALCVICTVDAQKPGNVSGGGTNTPLASSQNWNGGDVAQPFQNGAPAQQQQAAASGPQGSQQEPSAAEPGPSRVVFQAALAHDPGAVPAFAGEPGWTTPAVVPATPKLGALSFGGTGPGVPSPVCFTNLPEVSVQTVVLATRGSAVDLATLVDAPETARLRIAPDGFPAPGMTAAERVLTEGLIPGQWQIAEIDFSGPAPLASLFFGGTAGRPEWQRNWRGEIAEIVCFGTPPNADVRAGVANYLSIRWGVGGHPATPAQRTAAVATGLRYGLVWGTSVILK
jgi:hypothetical protein